MKVVLGLSGGMDSVTLLGYYLSMGYEVHAVSFLYGSKHSAYEMEAASNVIGFYRQKGKAVKHTIIDLRQAFETFQSNLLKSGGDIPEGHYEEESMKLTVVPGRNMILGSIMAGLAESDGAGVVALGVHAGDHAIYPDCRADFITAFHMAVQQSSDGKVVVNAPFIDLDKAGILKIGYGCDIHVPYELTRTCYKDQPLSCGKCGSCQERLEAFKLIGRKDPIEYV